jgi:hypothetical protein
MQGIGHGEEKTQMQEEEEATGLIDGNRKK